MWPRDNQEIEQTDDNFLKKVIRSSVCYKPCRGYVKHKEKVFWADETEIKHTSLFANCWGWLKVNLVHNHYSNVKMFFFSRHKQVGQRF